MALGTDGMTITTLANFIPELWGPMVIKAVEANLVMSNLLWDWSDPAKGGGDTIHIPNVSNLTANAKSANSQVTLNAPTEAMVTLLINRHDECSFLIEDLAKFQSSFNLMNYYTQKAGYGLAVLMDTNRGNLISGFGQTVGQANVNIGDEQILQAVEFLDLANAPKTDRHLVLYPTQMNALFRLEKYFKADTWGNGQSDILVNGRFGNIYGVATYVSTNLGTSGTPAARLNAMFHREAIAVAHGGGSITPRTQGAYILEYLGNLVVNDKNYGEIESRDPFGVWVRS